MKYKGRSISIKSKHDIFKGNVSSAGEFIFIYILVSVVLLVFSAFMVWYIFAPSNAENTVEQQVIFTACEVNSDEVVIESSTGEIYKIRFTDEEFDPVPVLRVCDGETELTVYSVKIKPKKEGDCYSVKAVLLDGEFILSFDEMNRLHVNAYTPIIFLPIACIFIWGAYVSGSIIVGRNPRKFSRRTVNFFFKPGYVRY